jgi:RimJ/RimL family protein N-acetyltransferase
MKTTLLTPEELTTFENHFDPMTRTEIYSRTPMIRVGIRLDDNTLIGVMSLFNVNPLSRKAEFGLTVFKLNTFLCRAMYKEVRQFLEECFNRLDLNRIYIKVHSDNARCLSSAEKMGFQYEGTEKQSLFVCGKYKDIVTMAILKNEFFEGK